MALQGQLTNIATELANKRVIVLSPESEEYPCKLRASFGNNNPPLLFAWGNTDLLSLPSIAIVGSRHCSTQGLRMTSKVASYFAQHGFNVVSGYAKGIDTMAHEAAARVGRTTIVLPFGILHYKPKSNLRYLLTDENTLVLSQFKPNQRWFVHAAMQRNKTICALSDAVIVVEARDTGGTLDEGLEALKQEKPLFVLRYRQYPSSAKGNELLISKGATPVSRWNQVVAIGERLHSGNHKLDFRTQRKLGFK